MSASKIFITDAIKYFPIKVMPGFSAIFTIFFLTKKSLLDTASYVNYTFIIAALLIISQISGGWVNSSVMYYQSSFDNTNDKKKFVVHISYLQFIFMVLGGIILFLIILFTFKSLLIALFIMLILFFQIFLNFNYSFFQAKRQIKDQAAATFIQAFLQILGVLICYYFFKGSLVYFFFFLVLSYLMPIFYLFFMKKNHFHFRITDSFSMKYSKEILSYGLPICLWFFSTQLYQIGDRLLFKYFDLTKNVGNYVSFRDLSVGLSGFVAMPLLFASHPIIMQLSKNVANKNQIENLLRKNIFILTGIFVPITIIIFFYGEFLIKYIVGEKYLLSPILMVVVLCTILLSVVSIYLQKGVETEGKTFLMLKISVIVALVSFLLNFIFIRDYGVVSAIYISLSCHLLYCIAIYFYSRKIFKIF